MQHQICTRQRPDLNGLTPMSILRRWPAQHPLAMLTSARPNQQWSRCSFIGCPSGFISLENEPTWQGPTSPPAPLTLNQGPLAALQSALAANNAAQGFWIASLSYELGAHLEPAIKAKIDPSEVWHLGSLAWCPWLLMYDELEQAWYDCGHAPASLHLNDDQSGADYSVSNVSADMDPETYHHAVNDILDKIASGDIFQANMTYGLNASIHGSPRALAAAALEQAAPWYGGMLELPLGRTVVSLSPELFLSCDPHVRTLTSRPIKGTLDAAAPAAHLLASEKDAAELHMIVDLMRNDLGRVCTYGSMRVPNGRTIESHPTVHHGVATIEGQARDSCSAFDILKACFPPGSITGAPKIRAMQILDELEPIPRGPYCGTFGLFGPSDLMMLNVAIRTLAIHGQRPKDRWDVLTDGQIRYGVGGGIVADSDPALERRECNLKSAVFRNVIGSRANDSLTHSDA